MCKKKNCDLYNFVWTHMLNEFYGIHEQYKWDISLKTCSHCVEKAIGLLYTYYHNPQ